MSWIAQVLDRSLLKASTLANYRTCLRYWDAWYRLRYSAQIPLAHVPPTAVSPEIVAEFIRDHSSLAMDGELVMTMPEALRMQLIKDGFLVKSRCWSPQTIQLRLSTLCTAHQLLGLDFEMPLFRGEMHRTRAAWAAARAAVGASKVVPISRDFFLERLLEVCEDNIYGLEDAALLVLLRRLRGTQIAELKCSDLRFNEKDKDSSSSDVMLVKIANPRGALQRCFPEAAFYNEDAAILNRWSIRRQRAFQDIDCEWLFVRRTRAVGAPKTSKDWVRHRLFILATRAGLSSVHGILRLSPDPIRCDGEVRSSDMEALRLVSSFARISVPSVLKYLVK